jgi:glutathione synthase
VEINTIAVAFAGITGRLASIHGDAMRKFCPEVLSMHGTCVAQNSPGESFACALAAGHREYLASNERGSEYPKENGSKPQVCFYCLKNDRLEMDQRHIQVALENLGVPCFRACLGARIELRDGDPKREGCGGTLFVDGTEVSVLYFHCAYCPEHFLNEADWENRRLIELSRAIKAPSLLVHLAGTKKVQQVLSDPGELSRFLSQDEVDLCSSVFARQFDPSRPDSASTVTAAIAKPGTWVLKPQREGGGNNLHGQHIRDVLTAGSGLEKFVLMEKISSAPVPAQLLQNGTVQTVDAISELGIFAVYLARGNQEDPQSHRQELMNTMSGAMLRTKHFSSDEGGVCAGAGVIDTPFLLSPSSFSRQSSPLAASEASRTNCGNGEVSLIGPPYRWLHIDCDCQFLASIYIKSVDSYFEMPQRYATDDDFWNHNENRVPSDYAKRSSILKQARNEVGRRYAIPTMYLRNISAACERYQPLHPELFMSGSLLPQIEAAQVFNPVFLEAWRCISSDKELPQAMDEVHGDCFSSPLLTRGFCAMLMAELKNFKSKGIPHQQPNTMNKHGCILNEIGLGPFMDWFLMNYISPVCRTLFPEILGEGIDSHHCYVVKYDTDANVGVHDDNSEVSVIISLSDSNEKLGGELALYHRTRCEHPQHEKLSEPHLHRSDLGNMLIYPGDMLHKVTPLENKEVCTFLVMWLRSDAYRRRHGCPLCGKTDQFMYSYAN